MKMFKLEKLGNKDDPYLIRFVIDFKLFSLKLHYWRSSDDLRYPHDHEWNFLTFILYGSYADISPDVSEIISAGDFRYRAATHQHSVMLLSDRVITFMICGPVIRKWGFWVNGKFRKRNKYFFEHGHH